MNANINRNGSDLSKSYHSEAEAYKACKDESIEYEVNIKDSSILSYYCLMHNKENRHWRLDRHKKVFKNYKQNEKKCRHAAKQASKKYNIYREEVDCLQFKLFYSKIHELQNEFTCTEKKFDFLCEAFSKNRIEDINLGYKKGYEYDDYILVFEKVLDPIRYYY